MTTNMPPVSLLLVQLLFLDGGDKSKLNDCREIAVTPIMPSKRVIA